MLMGKPDRKFCMTQFKPAIIALVILIVAVLAWSTFTSDFGKVRKQHGFVLAAAAGAAPPAGSIAVKDTMRHPYWGNCNKCHITVDVPGQPVSQVFAGGAISINNTMTHDYWGNCNLCHRVTGGFQPRTPAGKARLAAAPGGPPPIAANAKATHPDWGKCDSCHQILKGAAPVAFQQITAASLGLELRNITAAAQQKFGLGNTDGILVTAVAPQSVAGKAGLLPGDEIIRIGRTRTDTINELNTSLRLTKPGDTIKVNILRGKRNRNIYLQAPENMKPAAALVPRAPVYCPPQAMAPGNNYLPPGSQFAAPAATVNQGLVAVAAMGPSLHDQVATRFEASPYYILYDPDTNQFSSVLNPNYTDRTGNDVQSGQLMIDLGVSNVIAGGFSAAGFSTLRGLGLNTYSGVNGSVKNVVAMYRTGRLQPAAFNAGHSPLVKARLRQGPCPTPTTPARGVVF